LGRKGKKEKCQKKEEKRRRRKKERLTVLEREDPGKAVAIEVSALVVQTSLEGLARQPRHKAASSSGSSAQHQIRAEARRRWGKGKCKGGGRMNQQWQSQGRPTFIQSSKGEVIFVRAARWASLIGLGCGEGVKTMLSPERGDTRTNRGLEDSRAVLEGWGWGKGVQK